MIAFEAALTHSLDSIARPLPRWRRSCALVGPARNHARRPGTWNTWHDPAKLDAPIANTKEQGDLTWQRASAARDHLRAGWYSPLPTGSRGYRWRATGGSGSTTSAGIAVPRPRRRERRQTAPRYNKQPARMCNYYDRARCSSFAIANSVLWILGRHSLRQGVRRTTTAGGERPRFIEHRSFRTARPVLHRAASYRSHGRMTAGLVDLAGTRGHASSGTTIASASRESRDRDRLTRCRELATPSDSPAAALPSGVHSAPANDHNTRGSFIETTASSARSARRTRRGSAPESTSWR
jgi:hypothetical protein